jgi:hypothetical protein
MKTSQDYLNNRISEVHGKGLIFLYAHIDLKELEMCLQAA